MDLLLSTVKQNINKKSSYVSAQDLVYMQISSEKNSISKTDCLKQTFLLPVYEPIDSKISCEKYYEARVSLFSKYPKQSLGMNFFLWQ